MSHFEPYGVVAGILTVGIYIPQLIKTLKTKQTRDLSMLMLVLIVLCNIAWVFNGIEINSPSRYLSAIFVLVLTIPILYIKFKNMQKESKIKQAA
ncbi:SemiSWEET family sugar transporter [Sulfurimonas sp.]